ncbi:MAG: flagellar export chaperone FlgN, partial [bacterium]|nr:flagellar export chaperone FlgN [bacterium]
RFLQYFGPSRVHQQAEILQESPDELSLLRLSEGGQEQVASKLQGFRETLVELQGQIRKANRENTLLIKQSLKYVDKSLQILGGSGPAAGVYESSGRVENPTSSSLSGVVNQVV